MHETAWNPSGVHPESTWTSIIYLMFIFIIYMYLKKSAAFKNQTHDMGNITASAVTDCTTAAYLGNKVSS